MTLAFLDSLPLFLIILLPGIILSSLAVVWLKSSFARNEKIMHSRGYSGAQVARMILDANGLNHVPVEQVSGHLSDHYDPRDRMVRLSPRVYGGQNLSALGVAAHEVGHALQHQHEYGPLVIRNMAVPVASFGSGSSYILIIIGFIISMFVGLPMIGFPIALLGLLLFCGVLFFQLVNLPVEFNASTRARQQMLGMGIISPQEDQGVKSVLRAAAMTYVAGVVTSLLTLLYYVMLVASARE